MRKRNKSGVPGWVTGMAVLAFGAAAVSQAKVQVFGKEKIIDQGMKSGRYLIETKVSAKRGSIMSSDGKALAEDDLASEFGINFDKVPNSAAFFMDLAEATGIPASEFQQLASAKDVRSRYWREPMTADQTRAISKVQSRWKADGISIRRVGERSYPLGEAAAGFVGYLNDGKPMAGLEMGWNDTLQGKDGKIVGLGDRFGMPLPLRIDGRSQEKVDGKDIVLTIDSQLQIAATNAIRHAVEANRAESGSAVVIDPRTGDILAMANWPTYNPKSVGQLPAKGETFSDFNPCYMAGWEPGSTFKILTLAEGLQKGVVQPHEVINCPGSIQVWSNKSVRCDAHGGHRAHGATDPEKAIAVSCNVSAATWAMRIGHPDFTEYLDKLGLMESTHLGLPLERAGSYHRDEYAKKLQLATFGFGQSMTVTPVGLASAFSMLGNDGMRMQPRLIKSVKGVEIPTEEAGQVVSPEVTQTVLEFMESVVESDRGTGKTLRIPGYRLGGKTGTAQKINKQTGTVEGGGYVANFVGMVPAYAPRAVILVMVDNPQGGKYYGAQVAGPAFVDIARAVIRRLNLPPDADTAPKKSKTVAAALLKAEKPMPKEPSVDVAVKKVR
ncbi:MAG: penicillin-binding protein 2 [Fimbriimonadaceae bacterium]|nr:penicillin-binding protein 2 [Fimbriimonadaceae bacterium]